GVWVSGAPRSQLRNGAEISKTRSPHPDAARPSRSGTPSVIGKNSTEENDPTGVRSGQNRGCSSLSERSPLPIVRIGVIEAVVDAAAVEGLPGWVAPLELHVRQQHDMIEEVIVDEAEAIDVDVVVVLLEPIDGRGRGLTVERRTMVDDLLQVAVSVI